MTVKQSPWFPFLFPSHLHTAAYISQVATMPPICTAFSRLISLLWPMNLSQMCSPWPHHIWFSGVNLRTASVSDRLCVFGKRWKPILNPCPQCSPTGLGVKRDYCERQSFASRCWEVEAGAEGLSGRSVTIPSWCLLPNILKVEWSLWRKQLCCPEGSGTSFEHR